MTIAIAELIKKSTLASYSTNADHGASGIFYASPRQAAAGRSPHHHYSKSIIAEQAGYKYTDGHTLAQNTEERESAD